MILKSKYSFTIVMIGIIFFVVCVAGCVSTDPVVGTWKNEGPLNSGVVIAEFSNDGTGTLTMALFGIVKDTQPFRWVKTSDGKYDITVSSTGAVKPATLSDENKMLTIAGMIFLKSE